MEIWGSLQVMNLGSSIYFSNQRHIPTEFTSQVIILHEKRPNQIE